jgi:hypothetical protein
MLPVNFGCFPVVILVLSCCVLVWCHYWWNGRALGETWSRGISGGAGNGLDRDLARADQN